MEVVNDLLNYDNIKIVQNSDWFSFSLDSVLLANFVHVNNKMRIMDFCCGNAPIPLILSTKTNSKITGVEIQKEVFSLAIKSVRLNNKEKQIEIINEDVKNLHNIYETDSFDLITCNPPYFKYKNSSNINNNNTKALARHELSLALEDVFKTAKKILKNNGKLVIVHRTERLIDIICLMRKYNLEPKRIRFIQPFSNSNSNLVLIEASKNGNAGLKIESNLIVHDENNNYTEEVLEMFNNKK
mgnify:FL=1